VTSRARFDAALDLVAAVLVAGCVVAAAAGSSIQYDILVVGRPARWVLIGLLLAFALGRAALCLPVWRVPQLTAFTLIAFSGLCLVSVVWSVNSHGTLVRAVGQSAVVVAIGALAGCVTSRPKLAGRMLDGLLAAVAVVALSGFIYWLVNPSRAAIPASVAYPSRFRGIEESPNTAALLLAIGVALALARALAAQRAVARSGFILLVLGFTASIAASGSRGGLLAAFVGLFAVAVLAPVRLRTRVAVAGLVVAGLGISAWAMTVPKALPVAAPATAAVVASTPSRNAEAVLPLGQEIGNPWWTHRAGDSKRSLFNAHVRTRAWVGALHQALGRPLLGTATAPSGGPSSTGTTPSVPKIRRTVTSASSYKSERSASPDSSSSPHCASFRQSAPACAARGLPWPQSLPRLPHWQPASASPTFTGRAASPTSRSGSRSSSPASWAAPTRPVTRTPREQARRLGRVLRNAPRRDEAH